MESVYKSSSKPSILFPVQQNAKEQHFSLYITCLDNFLGHILFYFVDLTLDCHVLLYTSWHCLFTALHLTIKACFASNLPASLCLVSGSLLAKAWHHFEFLMHLTVKVILWPESWTRAGLMHSRRMTEGACPHKKKMQLRNEMKHQNARIWWAKRRAVSVTPSLFCRISCQDIIKKVRPQSTNKPK